MGPPELSGLRVKNIVYQYVRLAGPGEACLAQSLLGLTDRPYTQHGLIIAT